MAITSSKLVIQHNVNETLGANIDILGGTRTVPFAGLNISRTRTPTTTITVTKHGFGTVTMTAGAATLDLTALTGLNGVAVTGNGLKVVGLVLHNPSAAAITVAKGASNGYTGLGAAYSQLVPPGATVAVDLLDQGVTIDGTHKTLDISGTGSQTLQYSIDLGG